MTKPEAIIEMVMKDEKDRHFKGEKDNYIWYDFDDINDIHDYDLPHGKENKDD